MSCFALSPICHRRWRVQRFEQVWKELSARRIAPLVVALGAAWPRLAHPASATLLERVESVSQSGRAQLTFYLEGQFRYQSGHLSNPDRLFIDLLDVETPATLTLPAVAPSDPLVKQIRIGR